MFLFQHDNVRHGYHRAGKFTEKINRLFKSEKIYINKRSKGKVKFQVNMKLFILSWPSSRFKIKNGNTFLFDIDYVHRLKQ